MNTIEYGQCHCGCGQKTEIATRTQTAKGWVKGEPKKYIKHHHLSAIYSIEDPPDWYKPNEMDGYCHCGCGLKTKPARYTSQEQGCIMGAPRRFVEGHHIVNDSTALEQKKLCAECKQEKVLRYFYRSKKQPDGYTRQCMACYRQHDGDKKARTQQLRERNRRYIYDWYLAHPCVDCGEDDPVCLEFDHVRGEKKAGVGTLANNSNSIETIQAEIDKCDVVCANCHRRRTAASQDWYLDFAEVA